jgi:hypothetical protein
MKCTRCGQPVDPAVDIFCGNCGARAAAPAEPADDGIVLGRRPAAGPPPAEQGHLQALQQVAQPAPRPASQAPMFRLAFEESILKTYEMVQLRTGLFKRKRGQGTLYVTSARVVFYAWVNPRAAQRASWLLQQTKLEDISGMSVNVSRRLSPGLVMLTLFFVLAALGTLLTVVLIPLTVLFVILAVISLAFLIRDAASRGSIGVSIHSRENGHSPINVGHSGRISTVGLLGRVFLWPILLFFPSYSAIDVAFGDPADDAEPLVLELGALIIDLQTRGTLAYEHWGIDTEPERARSAGVL